VLDIVQQSLRKLHVAGLLPDQVGHTSVSPGCGSYSILCAECTMAISTSPNGSNHSEPADLFGTVTRRGQSRFRELSQCRSRPPRRLMVLNPDRTCHAAHDARFLMRE